MCANQRSDTFCLSEMDNSIQDDAASFNVSSDIHEPRVGNPIVTHNVTHSGNDLSDDLPLSVLYTNCDSFMNKREEFKTRILKENPDVIALTEIYPKKVQIAVQSSELELHGYQLFIPSEFDHSQRGVAIYVKNQLACCLVNMDVSKFKESVWVQLEIKHRILIIGCVYRSPSSSFENNQELCDLLTKVCARKFDHLLIVGDFNYKNIDWSTNRTNGASDDCSNFLDCVEDLYLFQHVQSPTRFRTGCIPSLLDLIFTNEEELLAHLSYDAPVGKSDHISLNLHLLIGSNEEEGDPPTRSYYHADYVNMRKSLDEIIWEKELVDLSGEEAWNFFEMSLQKCIDSYVPFKKRHQKKQPEWLNQHCKKAIDLKHKSWNKYQKSRSDADWATYVKHRNIASSEVKKAKSDFENKLADEVKVNVKSFWRYVKSQTQVKGGIPDLLKSDGSWAKSDQEKANTLNSFFGSVFIDDDSASIPFMPNRTTEVLENVEFTTEDIRTLLSTLDINKSPGPDGIHSRVLKELHNELAEPLQIIFNKLMKEGRIPDVWKKAHVVPLFKKGKRSDPSNYRPVSLTSLVCKIMEKIVKKALIAHLEKNNLLTDNQHGFRSGRSCVTQLLEVLEEWTSEIDSGHCIDCVYLDYRKAFDTVSHKRLICKLQAYGITGHILDWIAAYLSGRSQRVIVNGKLSASCPVSSGIPQGSVLGPVLFLCFINDLPEEVTSEVKLFADDTKVYHVVDNQNDAESLQKDIHAVSAWAEKWKLQFNVSKCKVVHYGKQNLQYDYTISSSGDQSTIPVVDHERDLGVTFDSALTFSDHVADIAKRANIKLGILKRSFSSLNERGWLKLYKTIIRPTLEYCNSVWAPMFKKDEDLLEKVQQRATRQLPHLRHLEYPERLEALGLETLVYRRQRAEVLQIYKIMKGIEHLDVHKFFQLVNNSRTRGHSMKVKKPRFKYMLRQNSFSVRSCNNWNSLPDSAVTASSVNQFKSILEKHWGSHPLKFSPYQRRSDTKRGK